jgi:hypothetical protein
MNMERYVLKNSETGRYVADMSKSTTGSSYTPDIRKAKLYPTREAANGDRCPGNEYAVSVREEMGEL